MGDAQQGEGILKLPEAIWQGSLLDVPVMALHLTIVQSMMRQYGNKGLRVIIIDSPVIGRGSMGKAKRRNFARDHATDALWWVHDSRKNHLASSFDVEHSPSTFLVSPEGIVTYIWDHLTLPAQLAFALEEIMGN